MKPAVRAETLCRALRIELTQPRSQELAQLSMAELESLLSTIEAHGRWP